MRFDDAICRYAICGFGIRYAHGMDAGGEVIGERYECVDCLLVDGSSVYFFFLELWQPFPQFSYFRFLAR